MDVFVLRGQQEKHPGEGKRGTARVSASQESIPRISGFLMTEPICLSACCPAFCTLTWESVSTSVSLGTMLGRQDDSCLGAQYAIAPSSSTDPADRRHVCSTEPSGTASKTNAGHGGRRQLASLQPLHSLERGLSLCEIQRRSRQPGVQRQHHDGLAVSLAQVKNHLLTGNLN